MTTKSEKKAKAEEADSADIDAAFTPSRALTDSMDAGADPKALREEAAAAEREKEPDHPGKTKESSKPAASDEDTLRGENQKRVDVAAPLATDGSFIPPQTTDEPTGTIVQHAHDTGSNLDAAARLADERDIGLPEPNAPNGLRPADEVEKDNKAALKQAQKDVGKDASVLDKENAERDALKGRSDSGIAKGDPVLYTHDDGQEYEGEIDEGFRNTFNLKVPGLNPPRMSGVRMAEEGATKKELIGTFCLDPQRKKQDSTNVQSFYGTPRERANPFSPEAEAETAQPA